MFETLNDVKLVSKTNPEFKVRVVKVVDCIITYIAEDDDGDEYEAQMNIYNMSQFYYAEITEELFYAAKKTK